MCDPYRQAPLRPIPLIANSEIHHSVSQAIIACPWPQALHLIGQEFLGSAGSTPQRWFLRLPGAVKRLALMLTSVARNCPGQCLIPDAPPVDRHRPSVATTQRRHHPASPPPS